MRSFFICGTDTGVGKTMITGLLADHLSRFGLNVITQKWVQTGASGPEDIYKHLEIMGRKFSEISRVKDLVCPYIFKFPGSPHLAARLEGKSIDVSKIKQSFKKLSDNFDCCIVEGSGGALVPLNEKTLMIDLVRDLGLPVMLVVDNKLGAINHALLTIEVLKKRRIKVLGVIFNDRTGKDDRTIISDNPVIVKRLSGLKVIGLLDFYKDQKKLKSGFRKMMNGSRILLDG